LELYNRISMQLAAEDFFEQNTIPDMELKRFEDFFHFFSLEWMHFHSLKLCITL